MDWLWSLLILFTGKAFLEKLLGHQFGQNAYLNKQKEVKYLGRNVIYQRLMETSYKRYFRIQNYISWNLLSTQGSSATSIVPFFSGLEEHLCMLFNLALRIPPTLTSTFILFYLFFEGFDYTIIAL